MSKVDTWRTLSMLRRRRIDALGKERDSGQRALHDLQRAHGDARDLQQAAGGKFDAHEGATREMLTRGKGFRIGDYLDRQACAQVLKERLDQASAKAKAAADAEQAQERRLEGLRAELSRQTARLEWLDEQLVEEMRRREEMLQLTEEEETAEASIARRLLERAVHLREHG